MKFARFILWDISGAVKSERAGLLRAAALNLGFGAVPQLPPQSGQIEVGLRPATFDPLVNHTERVVNRLVLGILVAALIISLSIVLVVYHPAVNQQWLGLLFGFAFVFV